ncbi:MAG: GTP-binding protein [Nitrospirae bacterium]|nr:MAG: GTP-binding protein [Nitrospirota bacterium]
MKTTVVAGMLGAGKTSFILNYLKNRDERVVVLVNDFGKLGIDGDIISQDGYESIELPSGCVCCTLKFDFVTTIKAVVKEQSPEHLIIEPSGVASPSAVIEALQLAGKREVTVVLLVDVNEFLDVYDSDMYGRFFEDQVRYADLVLLNKVDLSDSKRIKRCRDIISEWNHHAVITESTYGKVDLEVPHGSDKGLIENSSGIPHIDCETIALNMGIEPLDYNNLYSLFEDMCRSRYGRVVRAKGLFITDRGNYRIDLSNGGVSAERYGGEISESRLVVLGTGLKLTSRDIFENTNNY